MDCEHVDLHDGIAGVDDLPGDGLIEVACEEQAVTRLVLRDERTAGWVASFGGWAEYRQAMLDLSEGSDDVGPDPGEEHWGDSDWSLCMTHALEYRTQAEVDPSSEVVSWTVLEGQPA